MQEIKLIVSEIDGVITTGVDPVDELGNVLFKNFFIPDFEAINKLKAICPFVFISSDNAVSYNLTRRKNIPFYWTNKSDKLSILQQILMRYNVTSDETLYVGSKLSDIPCMQMVPVSFCTNTTLGFPTFYCKAGEGILTELYIKYFKKN